MNIERHQRLKLPIHKYEINTVARLFKFIPSAKRYFLDPDVKIEAWVSIKPETNEDESHKRNAVPKEVNASPTGEEIVKLFKYIIYMYDEGTDLTDEYPDDLRLRKDAAAKEAGFKRNDKGEWPDYVYDIMEFRDRTAVKFILNFLKTQCSTIWREIKIIEEELDMLYRQRTKSLTEGEMNPKNDLLDITRTRMDEKEDLLKKFYGAHDDLRAATEKTLLPVTPENVFSVMEFPDEFIRITQIRDVPPEARPH